MYLLYVAATLESDENAFPVDHINTLVFYLTSQWNCDIIWLSHSTGEA